MSDDMLSKMKRALEVYKVESVSAPKRLPIHESPLFPNMGPVQINVIEVCLAYPANDAQVRSILAGCGCVPAACILVNSANSAYEAILDGKEVSNHEDGPVLLNPEMKAEKPDADLVGDARIPSLIKELEDTRKYEYPDAAGGKTPKAKTTRELPVGTTSPIGTHQNKVINTRAGK
jgi:hypothetical protein